MSQMLVMDGTWRQNNASFYGYCQIKNRTAKVRKYCQKCQTAKPNHCQTTFENARFDLFGIFKCQLATLTPGYFSWFATTLKCVVNLHIYFYLRGYGPHYGHRVTASGYGHGPRTGQPG